MTKKTFVTSTASGNRPINMAHVVTFYKGEAPGLSMPYRIIFDGPTVCYLPAWYYHTEEQRNSDYDLLILLVS